MNWKKITVEKDGTIKEPELNKTVLVTDVNGEVGLGVRVNSSSFSTMGCFSSVIAWAPKPEPFKG